MKTEAQLRELYQAAGQVHPRRAAAGFPAAALLVWFLSRVLTRLRQGHVFDYWDECDAAEREALLAQLREVDPHAVNAVRQRPIRRPSPAQKQHAAPGSAAACCFCAAAPRLTACFAASDLQVAPAHGRRRCGGCCA